MRPTDLAVRFFAPADVPNQDFDIFWRALGDLLDYTATRKDTAMATGTVKWFNTQKGYGFIQPDEGGADVFVHISAVQTSGMTGLDEGQKISYEIVKDKRTGKSAAGNLTAA
ncbi:'Cold-shock' DNA-binding domain-containing protein [Pelagibacterium luteolum]|uniref:'Cold-shock' DNA-binding domain-containing protein n=2 Tax=Pelagibacterium luteolum TaxID=440168 RepID=A0A1G7UNR7_9HYPH|nr:'Cold-shock' DNA-binding domain-containing protein [Pelagibacterium luteolum]